MTGQVQWEHLITIITIFCGAVGAIVIVFRWLWVQLSELRQKHDEFRVEVAKEYVSVSNLTMVERRIETALTQLRNDFDRGFDRVVEVIKAASTAGRGKQSVRGNDA